MAAVSPIYRPATHASPIAVDDETILLDEVTGHLRLLNPTAALLWRCLDGASPLDDILDDLVEATGLDRAIVSATATTLLDDLLHRGLVELVEPAGSAGPSGSADP